MTNPSVRKQIWFKAGFFAIECIDIGETGSPDWHVALWHDAEQVGEVEGTFPLTADEARTLGVALLLAAAHVSGDAQG
ncbi:hypothetical protein [Burkholderia sp. LMG 13014]|uniref:hypothetical protein n=1 Tax=Burkholderia sp. LMG 13014 TaxID=2709306 RepID=UPI00196512E3|nr:hypothetical protein [Burkholderia sp. LMG 13014]